MTGRAAVVSGIGGWLPPNIVTNHDLSAELDTTDKWIRSRTGIGQRHVVEPGMATSHLATEAGRHALRSAGITGVDAVVLATSTPDRSCPAVAPEVASNLGLTGVPAFDVAAVCTGFLYALATASGLVSARLADSVLVIGADVFSTILDPADRTTRVIFGDGAGAMVLRAGDPAEPGALRSIDLGSDGSRSDLIQVPAGGSRQRSGAPVTDPYFRMEGKPVFTEAVLRMAESASTAAGLAGWALSDVDMLVAHQANKRILAAVGEQLGLPGDRIATHLDLVGNTVAASVPLALAHCVAAGQVIPGDRLILAGFGGGLTWGAAALSWPDVTPVSSHPPVVTTAATAAV
jgi:3-oxoacyl-[acyl-carrier-protein] synthase III